MQVFNVVRNLLLQHKGQRFSEVLFLRGGHRHIEQTRLRTGGRKTHFEAALREGSTERVGGGLGIQPLGLGARTRWIPGQTIADQSHYCGVLQTCCFPL